MTTQTTQQLTRDTIEIPYRHVTTHFIDGAWRQVIPAAGAAFDGDEALAAIGLEVGRPIMPMLASSAPDVAAAMAGLSPDGDTWWDDECWSLLRGDR